MTRPAPVQSVTPPAPTTRRAATTDGPARSRAAALRAARPHAPAPLDRAAALRRAQAAVAAALDAARGPGCMAAG